MATAPFDGVNVVPTEHIDCNGAAASRMARNQLPFGSGGYHELASDALLGTYHIVEADVSHQDVEVVVEVADRRGERCFVAVLLKDAISGASINGVLVDVDDSQAPSLLLRDAEDVAVEARRVYAYHIGVALKEIGAQDEVVTHLVHSVAEVDTAFRIEAVDVEVGDARDFVSRESNLLVANPRHFEVAVSGRDLGIVLHRPIQYGAKLIAHCLDSGCLQSSALAEGDEILPKDVGNLHRHKRHAVVGLKDCEVVYQTAERLTVMPMEFALCADTRCNDFDESGAL